MRIDHRLVLEILRKDGGTVGHVRLTPDWEPAIEWTRLSGLRRVGVWAGGPDAERELEPLWHSQLGEPYMRGFRVHFVGAHGSAWSEDFSLRYFGGAVRAAVAPLVENGELALTDGFLYRALAYRCQEADASPSVASFTTVEQPQPLSLRVGNPAALLARSVRRGERCAGDFEVFMPAEVLDEATVLTTRAGDHETGGILLGHLGRGGEAPEIFVEITAIIPARHTVGSATSLTFTSDTWTDVRRAVALRGGDELVMGWFHSHPQLAWCREKGCSLERQRHCAAADGFFSTDDLALHRTMFPRAFTLALVMTLSVKGTLPRLFGWRAGLFEARGFRVCTSSTTSSQGEASHVTSLVL